MQSKSQSQSQSQIIFNWNYSYNCNKEYADEHPEWFSANLKFQYMTFPELKRIWINEETEWTESAERSILSRLRCLFSPNEDAGFGEFAASCFTLEELETIYNGPGIVDDDFADAVIERIKNEDSKFLYDDE